MKAVRTLTLSILVWLGALVGPLLLSPPAAEAVLTHSYLSQITGVGNPVAVTVDSGSDVYVADSTGKTVDSFSAQGAPLAFSASEEYVQGSKLTGTPSGPFQSPQGVAVDDATGHLYVADGALGVVDVFSSTGEYLSQLTGTPPIAPVHGAFQEPRGLTVDQSTHDLYVSDPHREVVDVFNSSGTYQTQFGAGVLGGTYGESIAVNELTGNAYVADSGTDTLFVFDQLGSFLAPPWTGAATPAKSFGGGYVFVGLDQTTGHVYVADTQHHVVDEFAASATEEYKDQLTAPAEGAFSFPESIAIDANSGNVYVADAQGVLDVFGPYIEVPDVVEGEPSGITATSLTLNGTVNPEGNQITSCKFEYGTTVAYGQTAPCAQTNAQIGAGSSPVAVSASLTGLNATSTYHYRLVVANANGANPGKDAQVITAGPRIQAESSSNVGSSSATLRAEVDPAGSSTTVIFEYGPSAAYGSVTSPIAVGAGGNAVDAVGQLGALQPETVYHFRAVASNADARTLGSDATFTTMPAGILGLPDSRGYEMVSPASNADGNVYEPIPFRGQNIENGPSSERPFQAAADGHAIAYIGDPSAKGGSGSEGTFYGNQYLAVHAPDGSWTAANIGPSSGNFAEESVYQAFSSDLSVGILTWTGAAPLAATAPSGGYSVLYSRSSSDGSYQPFFTVTPPHRTPSSFEAYEVFRQAGESSISFAGANAGTGAVPAFNERLFEANDALTANAVDGGHEENNLYESSGGALRSINVLPNGEPAPNATFGAPPEAGNPTRDELPNFSHVISADGTRVFWSSLNGQGQPAALYMRKNPTQQQSPVAAGRCTISADACTVQVDAAVGGEGEYWTASADGSKVFFTKGDLYEYDVDNGQTTDLTPNGDAQGVMGASEDGSYVYFVAGGVLAAGASPQTCNVNQESEAGCNLYLFHQGHPLRFIALLSARERFTEIGGGVPERPGDWNLGVGSRLTQVTPDGRHLGFLVQRNFSGQTPPGIYLYGADTGSLSCVSCASSVAAEAAQVPLSYSNTYQQRWISADGARVFFGISGSSALVPQDTNGTSDVYEWERQGAGSCTRSAGCIYLLSGGTNAAPSFFADASASGDDVFIVTRAQLAPRDDNENYDLYDVRVDANRPAALPACSGAGCQGVPPAPPIFATPSSVTFAGVGNFAGPTTVKAKAKQKSTTRAQKLLRALQACKTRRDKHKLALCRAQARRRYGAPTKTKKSNRRGK